MLRIIFLYIKTLITSYKYLCHSKSNFLYLTILQYPNNITFCSGSILNPYSIKLNILLALKERLEPAIFIGLVRCVSRRVILGAKWRVNQPRIYLTVVMVYIVSAPCRHVNSYLLCCIPKL